MQKLLVLSNIILICIIAFLVLSPAEEEKTMGDVAQVASGNSIVQAFLKAYPDAGLQGYLVSKDSVEKNIEEIREDCGPDFEKKSYWRMEYMEPEENKTLKLWIDPETNNVACMVKNIVAQNVRIPFGMDGGEKEFEIRRGNKFEKKIHFFNINGDKDYYVKAEVLEKPPYLMEVHPPMHEYKAVGKEAIQMNLKISPSEVQIAEPDNYPDDVEYIELDEIDGVVKTRPLTVMIDTPQPMPLKEYPTETHNLVLNVSASYFQGSRAYFYENRILNYTIDVVRKK